LESHLKEQSLNGYVGIVANGVTLEKVIELPAKNWPGNFYWKLKMTNLDKLVMVGNSSKVIYPVRKTLSMLGSNRLTAGKKSTIIKFDNRTLTWRLL